MKSPTAAASAGVSVLADGRQVQEHVQALEAPRVSSKGTDWGWGWAKNTRKKTMESRRIDGISDSEIGWNSGGACQYVWASIYIPKSGQWPAAWAWSLWGIQATTKLVKVSVEGPMTQTWPIGFSRMTFQFWTHGSRYLKGRTCAFGDVQRSIFTCQWCNTAIRQLCLWCPTLLRHDVSHAFFGEARSRPESAAGAWTPRKPCKLGALAVRKLGGKSSNMGD